MEAATTVRGGGRGAVTAETRTRPRPVEREYAQIVERHRDELHAHSRRILRSSQDAEDALQEALLRAWRALPSFEGRSSLRAWLYRIVTNTSLDVAQRRPSRVVPIDLDQATPADHWHTAALEPPLEGRYLTREEFERALVVTMRVLPARQRAVLILREALGFSARETAGRLGISVPAANSYLQRARARLDGKLAEQPTEETPSSLEDGRLRERVERHADAWEHEDVDRLIGMLAEEAAAAE
jgi:RNA polymerase sigma-70 factor (ECF subfamily)